MARLLTARVDPISGKGGEEDLPRTTQSLNERHQLACQVLDASLVRYHQLTIDMVAAPRVTDWQANVKNQNITKKFGKRFFWVLILGF